MLRGKTNKSERFDVDARFLLANERTLLAWIRTGLAIQAGGLALYNFSKNDSKALAIGLLIFGAITALIGYIRYRSADHAIRKGKLPTPGYGPEIEVAGIIIIPIVILAYFR